MTEPADVEAEIVSAIRRIVRAIDLHSRWLVEQCGLTGPQLTALREVIRQEPVAVGALARSVHLSQGTVSGIVDRLERRGLVARQRSDADRRQRLVTATDEGRALLGESPSLLQDHFRAELARLEGWELHGMLSWLQRIATMMQAEELDAAPILETGPLDPAASIKDPVPGAPGMGGDAARDEAGGPPRREGQA